MYEMVRTFGKVKKNCNGNKPNNRRIEGNI